MSEFSVSTGVREGFEVVVVCGDIDETTAPKLQAAIEQRRDGRPIIVDMHGVSFISSAGLHVLFHDGTVSALAGLSDGNARVFAMIGASRCVPMFPDVTIVIQSLALGQSA